MKNIGLAKPIKKKRRRVFIIWVSQSGCEGSASVPECPKQAHTHTHTERERERERRRIRRKSEEEHICRSLKSDKVRTKNREATWLSRWGTRPSGSTKRKKEKERSPRRTVAPASAPRRRRRPPDASAPPVVWPRRRRARSGPKRWPPPDATADPPAAPRPPHLLAKNSVKSLPKLGKKSPLSLWMV